jgi:hypothetical protein
MSYSACSNSALLAPDDYPAGAIGSTITPTLLSVSTASGANYTLFNPVVIPKGVWIVCGSARFNPLTGGATVDSSVVQALLDAVNVGRIGSGTTASTEWLSFCYPFVADGIKALSMIGSATTSAGNYDLEVGVNSVIKIVRVA